MSPKAKHVLAGDHLDLARKEIEEDHLGVAATLLLVEGIAERVEALVVAAEEAWSGA